MQHENYSGRQIPELTTAAKFAATKIMCLQTILTREKVAFSILWYGDVLQESAIGLTLVAGT